MIYIPTWIDGALLLPALMIVYEVYRKDPNRQSIRSPRFISMVATIAWLAVTVFVNRNETIMSVPFFIGSTLCFGWAMYIRVTMPPKLPNEPSLD